MKILFVMKEPGEVRLLGSVLRLLDERGHSVHLAFQSIKTSESRAALRKLTSECAAITVGKAPPPGKSPWMYLSRSLRFGIDYLRYLEPLYTSAPKLRANAEKQAPPVIRRFGRLAARAGPHAVRWLRQILQRFERCIPPPRNIERFVAEHEPDVLLVTPLVGVGSSQADFLRAAKRLGIRTVYPLLSWDNLTTKGLVRDVADLVLVWNEIQVKEAVRLHGIPRDRIRVAGAWSWDHWFDWRPRRTRAEFCHQVGLREDRPIVLYVGSSWWVLRDEVDFVRRWVGALRAYGGVLADAGILVRPHPMRRDADWLHARLDDAQVAIWPRFPEQLLDDSARQNFFESIYYSHAVFGINTSAQIESAIVGRPVHTLLADEYQDTQQGTVHFHYLDNDGTGHLCVAQTLEEHPALLEASLSGVVDDGRTERFVRRFARPFGLEVPATPRFVAAVEELAALPAPAPDRGPALAPLGRLVMWPLTRLAAREAARRREQKPPTPEAELRSVVRRAARAPGGRPLVAGPWLDNEVGELLYWIPFLRWAQTATFGLHERLWVVARRSRLHQYRGLGAKLVPVDDPVGPEPLRAELARAVGTKEFDMLPARLLSTVRAQLAQQQPSVRIQERLLEFAPLVPAELPSDLELPRNFFAVRLAFGPAYPATNENREFALQVVVALARTDAVVVLDPPDSLRHELIPLAEAGRASVLEAIDGELETAVLARARGFFGSYGVSAYAAVLLGVPAVALYSRPEQVVEDDLRIARSFLARPPFGCLHAMLADPSVKAAALAALLAEGQGALLAV
jgi:hypothetical protein